VPAFKTATSFKSVSAVACDKAAATVVVLQQAAGHETRNVLTCLSFFFKSLSLESRADNV
jgi:hypothetical protein